MQFSKNKTKILFRSKMLIFLTVGQGNQRNFNQRYNQRQQYQNPMQSASYMTGNNPAYMVQTPSNSGVPNGLESIISNKFFQSRGLTGAANLCAYQQNQAAPFGQYPAGTVGYSAYPAQYAAPPTAAVQQ